jgi:hypothetical protein
VREANQLLGRASNVRFQGWMLPSYARVVVLADEDDEKEGRRHRGADTLAQAGATKLRRDCVDPHGEEHRKEQLIDERHPRRSAEQIAQGQREVDRKDRPVGSEHEECADSCGREQEERLEPVAVGEQCDEREGQREQRETNDAV